jgi:hypothetical protein
MVKLILAERERVLIDHWHHFGIKAWDALKERVKFLSWEIACLLQKNIVVGC